jgi:hypothetical protein
MHVLNKHDYYVRLPMIFRIPSNENKFEDGDSVISPSHLRTRNITINITGQSQSESQSHVTTDGQSVGLSWCRASSGAHDQISIYFFYESYSPVYMGSPL